MASETIIEADIERLVGTYSLWIIGTTNNPEQREVEIGAPMGWCQFDADSELAARKIEAYCFARGMHEDTVGRVPGAKYVYIFMGLQARLEGRSSVRQGIR
ncbi:MAG: hypothetical protein O2913_03105 [Chloroflexi bacterium]|nr:hypothetical protein [Chloroflexota bacterium]